MDRVGARPAGGLDDAPDVQVALSGRPGPEQVGLVGPRDVQAAAVRLRVNGHRLDPELAQRSKDTDGDLAPIGDEHLPERRSLEVHRPYSVRQWASQTS